MEAGRAKADHRSFCRGAFIRYQHLRPARVAHVGNRDTLARTLARGGDNRRRNGRRESRAPLERLKARGALAEASSARELKIAPDNSTAPVTGPEVWTVVELAR